MRFVERSNSLHSLTNYAKGRSRATSCAFLSAFLMASTSGPPRAPNASKAFCFLREREENGSRDEIPTTEEKTEPAHANLSSTQHLLHRWNCSPTAGRCSRRDMENALAALHASMAFQRLSQAASALLWALSPPLPWPMRTGTWLSRWTTVPPTSAARTTKRARPPSPEGSGYTRSFLLRAASRAAPT